MAIFNSYVKLPEGILYSYFWFWNLANKNRHFDWHKMEKTWFGKQPFLQGRKTKLMEKKCTHTHTRFTSLLGLSQCWRVQYSILMQSWHTKPFAGPLPPWLWAILPMMILPAGFIKGFQPRRKCWKHQETSGNIRKTQMCSHVLTIHVPRFSEKSHPSRLVGHVPLQCVWDDPGSVEGQGRQFQRAAQWAEGSGVRALEISCSPLVVRYPKWCIVECVLLWATMMGI